MSSTEVEHKKRPSTLSSVTSLHPSHLLPTATIGFVIGLLEVTLTLSFAALIFTGSLSGYLSYGVGFGLLGVVFSSIIITLFSSLPGTIGGSQDTPAAIMAIMSVGIMSALPANTDPEALFITVLVTVALSTFLTGVCTFLLGTFSLGNLVRFLPYPVVGGFLAGTGWLLVIGALGLAIDGTLTADLLQPEALLHWLPGAALAVLLLFLLKRFSHFWLLPGIIFLSIAVFYGVTAVAGLSIADLHAQGWLLGPFPDESLWRLPPWDKIGQVQWSALWSQLPNVATLILLSIVGLLLNVSGLELTVQQDASLNRELRMAGLGNMLAGLAGGLISFQQLSLSALNVRVSKSSRLGGLIAAAVCLVTLSAGASLLSLFPRLVLTGLLGYLGLGFLKEWVIDARSQLSRMEYGIVLVILVIIATVGFLEGVAVGVVAAIILFVAAYSRTDVVRQTLTGANMRSRVTRPAAEQERLQQNGECIYILRLQGFIFFGTADKMLGKVKERLADAERPLPICLLLDFRRVTGLDATALISLQKLQQATNSHQTFLVITDAPPTVHQQLVEGGLNKGSGVHFFADLDQGLAWSEDQVLRQRDLSITKAHTLAEQLLTILPDHEAVETLLPHLRRQEAAPGTVLMHEGDPPDSLYFIESGQVTAQTAVPGRLPVRLETMGPGRVVGELGFYLGQARTASVVVDETAVVYELTRQELDHMDKDHPAAASALHRLIIYLLADRVTHLVTAVNALEQ